MSAKVSPTLKVLQEIRDRMDRSEAHQRELASQQRELAAQHRHQADEHRVFAVTLTTEVVAMAGAVREVRDLLATKLDQRDQVADHERRIRELELKTG